MRILAIETTGQAGSVALFDDGARLAETVLPPTDRSAKALAPVIQRILADNGWRASDIRVIAVATGPGSFTGLRIGVTTAKTLAYALGAQVIGVNSLAVIAAQAPGDVERLSTVMDAQRQQVFAANFARGPGDNVELASPITIMDNEAWLAQLAAGAVVSGPALEKLAARLPTGVLALAAEHWAPRAATVARLGWRRFETGERDDLWRLVPQYFRQSAAEEKLTNERGSNDGQRPI